MTNQTLMWDVLACDKAAKDCDGRRDEGKGFRLESPVLEPTKGTAEDVERAAARVRWLADEEKRKGKKGGGK
jgi:hypothetical protein